MQFDLIVVVTLIQPPARFARGQKELFLREWRPPAHQRIALVVHNPSELLGGKPHWMPAQLLQHAVGLRVVAQPQEEQDEEQDGGEEQPQKERRQGGSSKQRADEPAQQRRRLAAAEGEAGGTVSQAVPQLQLLALSPNVAAYTAHMVQTWAGSVLKLGPGVRPLVDIPWLPPLVPWEPSVSGGSSNGSSSSNDSSSSRNDSSSNGGAERPMRHICMQASYRYPAAGASVWMAACMHEHLCVGTSSRWYSC